MSRSSRRQLDPHEDEPKDGYDVEADDEVDDDEEVTRCVCGQDELDALAIDAGVADTLKHYGVKIDHGLFIQCDKCLVWQHGYCVGLFTNDDVPDKYWCEQCKPDLHHLVIVDGDVVRTLYRPTNRTRTKLFNDDREAPAPKGRARRRGDPPLPPAPKRKRHYEDYDEQLQRALRESAQELGVAAGDDGHDDHEDDTNTPRTRTPHQKTPSPHDKLALPAGEVKEENGDPSPREDTEDGGDALGSATSGRRLKKLRPRAKKSKTPPQELAATQTKKELSQPPQISRAELLAQPSRPRFVAEALSIYELRKRTGAILEWLGRSQMELEEERQLKIALFNYKETTDDDSDDPSAKVIRDFNDNLKLMERLTERILLWEQKFGKYAP